MYTGCAQGLEGVRGIVQGVVRWRWEGGVWGRGLVEGRRAYMGPGMMR